jgi:F-type H+-transporting ATPase subunit c
MNKKLMVILLVILVFSITLSAEEAAPVKKNVEDATPLFLWSIIVGAVALAAAAIFGAFAQSKAIRVASDNIGRNPAAADSIRTVVIIGLALIESLVIYVLLIDLIIFFVKWGSYTY